MASHYTLTSFGLELPRAAGSLLIVAADIWRDNLDGAREKLSQLEQEDLNRLAAAIGAEPEADAIIVAIEAMIAEIDPDRMPLGIAFAWDSFRKEPTIWAHSDESFSIESTVALIQSVMAAFEIQAVFTIRWAETCSKPAYDEFGGGAVVFNAEDATWITLHPAIEAAEKALAAAPKPATPTPAPGAGQ